MRGMRYAFLLVLCFAGLHGIPSPAGSGAPDRAATVQAAARTEPDPLAPENIQGCYKLHMSPWRPDLHLGEDSVFIAPPRAIQLFAERGTKGFETNGYVVRPAPGFKPTIHRGSYWQPKAPDAIQVVWTTGFSGLSMVLKPEGQNLRGTAKTSWDFNRTEQTADVFAQRFACGKS